jgi:hypothetical protein
MSVRHNLHMAISSSTQRRLPWLVLLGSLFSVPIIFLGASVVSQPHWDWDTSFYGHFIAQPLLLIVLGAGLASSPLTPLSLRWRIALSVGALTAFAVMLAASYALCIIFFGAPFH